MMRYILKILFPTAISTVSIFLMARIPFVGSALSFMMPLTLPFFGSTAMSQALAGMGFSALAFAIHGKLEGPGKDTRIYAATTLVLSMVGLGVMHNLTQHMRRLSVLLAYLSGSVSVGLAIQGLWIIGVPLAIGYAHYSSQKSEKNDKIIIDALFLSCSLMAGALAGWYTANWRSLNPFKQQSTFTRSMGKISPHILDPQSTIAQIMGNVYTKASLVFSALRGAYPGRGSKIPVPAPQPAQQSAQQHNA